MFYLLHIEMLPVLWVTFQEIKQSNVRHFDLIFPAYKCILIKIPDTLLQVHTTTILLHNYGSFFQILRKIWMK